MLPEVINTITQTVTNTVTVTVPGEEAEEPAPENPVVVVPPEEPETPPEVEIPPEEPPLVEQPEDFVDLDENPTPLNPGDLQDEEERNSGGNVSIMDLATPLASLPAGAKVGIGAVVVLGAAVLIWFLVARRKKENGKEETGKEEKK